MRDVRVLGCVVGFGLVVGVGCGGSGGAGTGSGTGGSTAWMSPFPNALNFDTGSFQVPSGDSLTCFYTNITTDHEYVIRNTAGHQGPGGHHITVYYTTVPMAPTHHPCTDAEMISWNQIGGAASGGEPVLPLPDGAAIKVPANVQIVIQAHYVNTTASTETTDDRVSVEIADPSTVQQYVNFWVINDDGFTVQPASTGKSVSTCTFPQELKTVILLGHMHEFGTHYTLEQIDAAGNTLATVYDKAWQPSYMSHPPLITTSLAAPLDIAAGTIFRQTCTWNNSSPNPLTFPTEMCVAFGYYFPDNGFIDCKVTNIP